MLKKRPQVMVGNDYTEQLESCEQFVALIKTINSVWSRSGEPRNKLFHYL